MKKMSKKCHFQEGNALKKGIIFCHPAVIKTLMCKVHRIASVNTLLFTILREVAEY